MRDVTLIALGLGALLTRCSQTPTTTVPATVAPVATRCRCTTVSPLLAEIEITDDPVMYRRQADGAPSIWEAGLQFHVSSVATMYRQPYPLGSSPPPPTFVARVLLSGPSGAVVSPSGSSPLQPVRGLRAIVTMDPSSVDAGVWNLSLYRVEPSTNALGEGFYQFATGTPVGQVLDPAQWGDPSRGCDRCGNP